jgi:putative membrane protein
MLATLANITTFIVGILHYYALYLEMFAWRQPKTMKLFNTTSETAEIMAVLAANQGLYNGFLATGLLWSLTLTGEPLGLQVRTFFLLCVFIAGLYGAATANKRILYTQAVPGFVAMALSWLAFR